MKSMKIRLLPGILFFFLLAGCTPFTSQALKQVDVTAPFQEVQKSPQKYLNGNVLWGGTIIETNVKTKVTDIKVVDKDLDYSKRPEEGDKTYGRFIVRFSGFLDPAIYKQGREITVIGTIIGVEVQQIGELQYTYPVVEARQMHLWEQLDKYRRPPYWDYPLMPYPYGWYPYPYGRPPYW